MELFIIGGILKSFLLVDDRMVILLFGLLVIVYYIGMSCGLLFIFSLL